METATAKVEPGSGWKQVDSGELQQDKEMPLLEAALSRKPADHVLPDLAKAAGPSLWAAYNAGKADAGEFVELGSEPEAGKEARRAEQRRLDADGHELDEMS